MSNMSGQNKVTNTSKVNRLQSDLPTGLLAPSSWLDEHGYYRQLVGHYVASGWLESPARGVYRRPGYPLKWQHVVASLLLTEGLPLHIGGASALEHAGFGHYARMREAETIRLYSPGGLPGWARSLSLPVKFTVRPDAMFGSLPLPRVWVTRNGDIQLRDAAGKPVSETELAEGGLRLERWGESDWPLVYATEERAILEMLRDVPGVEPIHEAHVLLQGLVNLRPARLNVLLRHCASIKAKRLFLALAARHRHAWFEHLDLSGVDLGKGNRALFPGGKLDPKYQISLPADLDDHAR